MLTDAPLTHPTILIVDDCRDNIQLLRSTLDGMCDFIVVHDGHEAVSACIAQQPDLILLDVMMPGLDGYQVISKLKMEPLTRQIPVIFLTAMDQVEHESVGLDMGAIDYITKPFNAELVRLRVRNQLELKRLRDFYRERSAVDGLTGVANLPRFEERLDQEARRAARAGEPLSLLTLDLDRFHAFNEAYGHLSGDDAIKRIAKALQEKLARPGDLVARCNGARFSCILPHTDARGARIIAAKLLECVAELNISHSGSDVANHLTVSIGGVSLKRVDRDASVWMREQVALRLQQAKQQGRNRVCFDEDCAEAQ
ncbi:diguanylate cyclase domain-containing protein [Magnetofaba australis]|nr:diguanylate cyclase [Magnetofaba australis]